MVIDVTDVNDNAPEFPPKPYTVTVPELMAVGSPVVTVEATDKDVGMNARLTYSIVDGTHSPFFYADSIYAAGTGVIRVQKVTRCDLI